jgi:hypothetical protein
MSSSSRVGPQVQAVIQQQVLLAAAAMQRKAVVMAAVCQVTLLLAR